MAEPLRASFDPDRPTRIDCYVRARHTEAIRAAATAADESISVYTRRALLDRINDSQRSSLSTLRHISRLVGILLARWTVEQFEQHEQHEPVAPPEPGEPGEP